MSDEEKKTEEAPVEAAAESTEAPETTETVEAAPEPEKKVVKKKRTRRKKKTPEEVWQELVDEVGEENPPPYSMNASYTEKSAISHPKFGVGVITEAMGLKINVTFQDGERFLVHNRK